MTAADGLVVSGLSIVTPANVPLVEDTGFEVGRRELVLLVGPSGSGKTSIINALCGLLGESDYAWQVRGRIRYGERHSVCRSRGLDRRGAGHAQTRAGRRKSAAGNGVQWFGQRRRRYRLHVGE